MICSPFYDILKKKRIAIVHDALAVPAGSERSALYLSNIFPDAPIYISVYFPDNTYQEFKYKRIHPFPLSKFIKTERQYKAFYPWWFLFISLLDLSQYDLIISSSNFLAKFINPSLTSTHICYLHNPIRYLRKTEVYSSKSAPYGHFGIIAIRLLLPILCMIEIKKTKSINNIITNSKNIDYQIKNIYQKNASIIYPPVDTDSFSVSNSTGDYYLYAERLISHKRVDLVICACNKLKKSLVIAGDGLEREALKQKAGDTIQFLGRVSDIELKRLYSDCKALIFPSDEDFGLFQLKLKHQVVLRLPTGLEECRRQY